MITFRLAHHSSGSGSVVEVWHDGQFIASIYGRENAGGRHAEISLITKHGADVREEVMQTPFLHSVYILIDSRP